MLTFIALLAINAKEVEKILNRAINLDKQPEAEKIIKKNGELYLLPADQNQPSNPPSKKKTNHADNLTIDLQKSILDFILKTVNYRDVFDRRSSFV